MLMRRRKNESLRNQNALIQYDKHARPLWPIGGERYCTYCYYAGVLVELEWRAGWMKGANARCDQHERRAHGVTNGLLRGD